MLCSLPGDGHYAVDRERNRVMKAQIEEELKQLEDEVSDCKRKHKHIYHIVCLYTYCMYTGVSAIK